MKVANGRPPVLRRSTPINIHIHGERDGSRNAYSRKSCGIVRLNLALFGLLTLVAVFGAVKPAEAQRPTRVYGSAYSIPLWQNYTPFCYVYFWDDYGNSYGCRTNEFSNWWYDNVPTNRWYTFIARRINWPYTSSYTVRMWVPSQAWWQINKVRIPDLKCH